MTLKLDINEVLKFSDILSSVAVLHRLENSDTLGVRKRAEWVGLDKPQHCVNDLGPQQWGNQSLTHSTHLLDGQEQCLKKLDGAQSGVSDFLNRLLGLVNVLTIAWQLLVQHHNAVVSNVGEVLSKELLNLGFALVWNLLVGVGEFSHNCGQQVSGVTEEVVSVTLAANGDQLLQEVLLSQQVEAMVILAELHQDGVGVQGDLDVVLVAAGKLVHERANNQLSFVVDNFLHFQLIGCEYWLFLVIVVIVVVAAVGLVHV